jgi:hypothetical protein
MREKLAVMMDLGLNWRSGWSNRFCASVVPKHEDCLACSVGILQTEVKVHEYNARVIFTAHIEGK